MKRMPGKLLFLCLALCGFVLRGAEDLKTWLDDPELWQKEDAQIQKKFGKSLVWRDSTQRELYCPAKDGKSFTYGEFPVYDLILNFKENRLNSFSFAVFSRGDFKAPEPPAAPAPEEKGKKKKRKSDVAKEERRKKEAEKEAEKNKRKALETEFKKIGSALKAEYVERFKCEPELKQSRFSGSRKTVLSWKNESLVLQFTLGSGDGNAPEYLSLSFSAPLPKAEKKKDTTLRVKEPEPPKIAKISKEELRSRVKSENGDHFFELPMVDQGNKGYCVPATVLRVLHYYGIPMELHALARMLNTDPVKGTAVPDAVKRLQNIDGRLGIHYLSLYQADFLDEDFAERFQRRYNQAARRQDLPPMGSFASPKFYYPLYHKLRANSGQTETFFRKVRNAVDGGIPLLWSVYCFDPKAKSAELAPASEAPPADGEKKKSKKERAALKLKPVPAAAGHLRLITGYREEPRGVIFSDSWGKGFEKEFLELDEAWTITTMLFLLMPNR